MALKEMTPHRFDTQDSTLKPCFKYTDTDGDWIKIPAGVDTITAILDATSGASKIVVTNDIDGLRSSGDTTSIIEWDEGVLTSSIFGVEISNVAAVKQVISSGTATLHLVAK